MSGYTVGQSLHLARFLGVSLNLANFDLLWNFLGFPVTQANYWRVTFPLESLNLRIFFPFFSCPKIHIILASWKLRLLGPLDLTWSGLSLGGPQMLELCWVQDYSRKQELLRLSRLRCQCLVLPYCVAGSPCCVREPELSFCNLTWLP